MNKITLEHVSSVYSGKDGSCCCGCSGTHSYAADHTDWASKHRGYTVSPDEVNDKTVKMIVNKMNRNLLYVVQDSDDVVSMVLPGTKRLYVVYLHGSH